MLFNMLFFTLHKGKPLLKQLNLLIAVILLACIGCTRQEGRDTTRADGLEVEVFPQLGHNSSVSSVAISPDGKKILSISSDNSIKLWDTESGREIRTFSGYEYIIRSALFNLDGKCIVLGTADKTIKLWDLETGENIGTFLLPSNNINSVEINHDGKQIISCCDNSLIIIWDVETEQAIKIYEETDYNIDSVLFSPDGKKFLYNYTAYNISFIDNPGEMDINSMWKDFFDSRRWELALWDFEIEQEIATFTNHDSMITSVSFSTDGKLIVSGSDNGALNLWDVETGQEIILFSEPNTEYKRINSVAFSHDGNYIISGYNDGTLRLWDVITGKQIRTFIGHYASVNSVIFNSDGKYIFSCSSDNTIKLWDMETGRLVSTFSGYSNRINAALFHPYEKKILSGSGDGTLRLWDIEAGQQIRNFSRHTSAVTAVAFSPDGKQVLSGSDWGQIKMWDTVTGMEIANITDMHRIRVDSVTFNPCEEYFLSGSLENVIIGDTKSKKIIKTFPHGGLLTVTTVFSPDGKKILSGYIDGTIRLWDIESGLEMKKFSHGGTINSITFSIDGKYILSGSSNKIIKIWDVETGMNIKTFRGHTDSVRSVAFSQDEKYIISGSDDNTIKLWDIDTEMELKQFYGHTSGVVSVFFSHNDKYVLSSSNDGTVRIWNIATGKEIASFISFTDGEWIVITPDGYYNASPKGDEHLNVRIGNEVFGIDQFAAAFYQPEVVEARLQGKKDDPPIVKSRGDIRQATAPPGVDISVINQETLTETAELAVTIYDQFKPIGNIGIEITVNGRLIGESELQAVISTKGIKPDHTRLLASSKKQKLEFTIPVKLEPGFNFIEVIADNDYSYGFKRITLNTPEPAAEAVGRGSPPETEIQPKGDLRILAIGVNNYTKNKLKSGFGDLRYPASDIEKVIDSFKDQGGPGKRYNKVHTLIISDYELIKPTKRSILANLGFLKKAGPNDTVLLFLSGHGETENRVYYFLPSDTVFTGDGKFDPKSAVNIEALVKALNIPGRKIVMLDTCDSGGAGIKNRLVRTLKNRSTVVFTACQDGEKAWEAGEDGEYREYGGYFAHSIAEGISGKAASESIVQIKPLGEYISERVAALNKETGTPPQNPVKYIPDGYQNFVISMVE